MATESSNALLVGGHLVARRLKAHGVTKLFTLSGGHLFSIYDGCRVEGIDIVDVRHEQTAAFAAEGWAKVTRRPGVAAVTAGPGVTNTISAIASAQANHSPMLVLGGRAPTTRWGQGSLQEIGHVPLVAPLTKLAATIGRTSAIPSLIDAALAAALTPHGGASFLDFPLDHVFSQAAEEAASAPMPSARGIPGSGSASGAGADRAAMDAALALLRRARQPAIMAGTDLYWGHGEEALRALAEELRIPVFLNGLARGCVPADHELFFSRARSSGLRRADVALLIGVPMDFRLAFGAALGADAQIVAIDRAPPPRPYPRAVAAGLFGDITDVMDVLREAAPGGGGSSPSSAARDGWISSLREIEDELRSQELALLEDERAPLHPMRVYGELGALLERDAIVVGDGGDFVSYAGRMIESFAPGCWLDPGPFGCLGSGPGYALAAKLAHPERQVVLLLGDGAFGFSAMEFDTLARHGVAVVGVMGNNGIWGLEKHPMELIYGYSVAADLRPETRYDVLVEALGGHGELVRTPAELRPALERAFAAGTPALVNVLTDPAVAYPRRSSLA
ncbi:MAG TPA: acetolactate synthase [Solirubrobacteraceae bacterium]|nr:acetolactate synthase [Solirubrobacteraceae bacterium]